MTVTEAVSVTDSVTVSVAAVAITEPGEWRLPVALSEAADRCPCRCLLLLSLALASVTATVSVAVAEPVSGPEPATETVIVSVIP